MKKKKTQERKKKTYLLSMSYTPHLHSALKVLIPFSSLSISLFACIYIDILQYVFFSSSDSGVSLCILLHSIANNRSQHILHLRPWDSSLGEYYIIMYFKRERWRGEPLYYSLLSGVAAVRVFFYHHMRRCNRASWISQASGR